jgi:hypothetical protein
MLEIVRRGRKSSKVDKKLSESSSKKRSNKAHDKIITKSLKRTQEIATGMNLNRFNATKPSEK